MKNEYILLIGTLGGALIGFLSSIFTMWISKYYENKKAYRNLLIETGLKNWEGAKEFALTKGGNLYPLDSFIIHQSKLLKLIDDDKLTKENLKKLLEELKELNEVFKENTEKIENNT